jgi:hypothetical protein
MVVCLPDLHLPIMRYMLALYITIKAVCSILVHREVYSIDMIYIVGKSLSVVFSRSLLYCALYSLSMACSRSVVFSGTPVSSTNKTDRHNITEILLKVALNTELFRLAFLFLLSLSNPDICFWIHNFLSEDNVCKYKTTKQLYLCINKYETNAK